MKRIPRPGRIGPALIAPALAGLALIAPLFLANISIAEENHFKRLQAVQEETALLKKLIEREKLIKDQDQPEQFSPWVYQVCQNLVRHGYCQNYRSKWATKAPAS